MTGTRNRIPGVLLIWVLAVCSVPAQGVIRFANLGPGVDAPFFGTDGTNRLSGSNFVAALYVTQAGAATTGFLPVGQPRPFQEGASAGYWSPINLPIPGFTPGAPVRVQIRFWDRTRLPNGDFEDAELAGADIGVAEIPVVQLNLDGTPTPLFELASAGLIPTLTLSRGSPLTASDPGIASSSSQLHTLCGVPVGTNRWFRLTSPQDAIAVLNTDSSAIDTVMAAFTGSIVNLPGLQHIICNDDRATGRTSSAIQFPVRANTLYLICVAGKNNGTGPVRLNYAAGVALQIRPWFDHELELTWPADGGFYSLETSAEPLQPESWTAVPTAPQLDGNRWILQLHAVDRQNSFRLRALP